MDTMAGVCDMWSDAVARRRLLLTECRLLQYRVAHHSLPAKLPDNGRDSIDPFSGRPFIYRPKGDGFLIYSLGRNRRDDGGVGGRNLTEGDLVGSF